MASRNKWRRIVVEGNPYRWIWGTDAIRVVRLDERGKGVATHVMPHPEDPYEDDPDASGPSVLPSEVAEFVREKVLGLTPMTPQTGNRVRYPKEVERPTFLGPERIKLPFADDAQGGYAVWLHRSFYDDDRGDTCNCQDLMALRFDAKAAKQQVTDLEQTFGGLRDTMTKYPNWEADGKRKELVDRHLEKMIIYLSTNEVQEQRRARERVAKMMANRWDSFHFTTEVW